MNETYPNSFPCRCRQPLRWLAWLLVTLIWLAGCQTTTPRATPTTAGTTPPSPTVAFITTATETVPCPLRGSSRLLAFSANGQHLAYGYQESTRSRLYLLDVAAALAGAAGAPKLLADDGWEFAWDPQGERLVYAGASGRSLTLLDLQGEKIGEINTGWQHASPAWSLDGMSIALLHTARRRDDAGLAASGLMWVQLDKLDSPQILFSLKQLAALSGVSSTARDRFNGGPVWSPNGEEMAVVATDGLFRVGLAEEGPVRLTSADICVQYPLWSPDGAQIAFLSTPAFTVSSSGWSLQIINRDGSGLVTLVSNSDLRLEQFSWSPDGARIAFTARTATTEPDLYLINRDGSGLTSLAMPATGPKYVAAWFPDNAPDGAPPFGALAVLSDNELGLINLDSNTWVHLGVLPQR